MDHKRKQELRNAIAGLVKGLIRARARQASDFLTEAGYKRWGVEDIVNETRSTAQLLRQVQGLKQTFYNRFYDPPESIPAPSTTLEQDAADELYDLMSGFIFGDLEHAIRAAAAGSPVDWDGLASWGELGRIRDLLDRLPASPGTGGIPGRPVVARSPRVTLYGRNEEPEIDGRMKQRLTSKRYDLIRKLIETRPDRCSKTQLERITSNYWQSLKDLASKDEDWNSVIKFAGKSHQGYTIE